MQRAASFRGPSPATPRRLGLCTNGSQKVDELVPSNATLTHFSLLLNDSKAAVLDKSEETRLRAATGMMSSRWQRFEKALSGKQHGPDSIAANGYLGLPSAPDEVSPSIRRRYRHQRRFLPCSNRGGVTSRDSMIQVARQEMSPAQHAVHTPCRVIENVDPETLEMLRSFGASTLLPLQSSSLYRLRRKELAERDEHNKRNEQDEPRPLTYYKKLPSPSPEAERLVGRSLARSQHRMRQLAKEFLEDDFRSADSVRRALLEPYESLSRQKAKYEFLASARAENMRANRCKMEEFNRRRAVVIDCMTSDKEELSEAERMRKENVEARKRATLASPLVVRSSSGQSSANSQMSTGRRQSRESPRQSTGESPRNGTIRSPAPHAEFDPIAEKRKNIKASRFRQEQRAQQARTRRKMLLEQEAARADESQKQQIRRDEQASELVGRKFSERVKRFELARNRNATAERRRREYLLQRLTGLELAATVRDMASDAVLLRMQSQLEEESKERRKREAAAEARRDVADAAFATQLGRLEKQVIEHERKREKLAEQRAVDQSYLSESRVKLKVQERVLLRAIEKLRVNPRELRGGVSKTGALVWKAAGGASVAPLLTRG